MLLAMIARLYVGPRNRPSCDQEFAPFDQHLPSPGCRPTVRLPVRLCGVLRTRECPSFCGRRAGFSTWVSVFPREGWGKGAWCISAPVGGGLLFRMNHPLRGQIHLLYWMWEIPPGQGGVTTPESSADPVRRVSITQSSPTPGLRDVSRWSSVSRGAANPGSSQGGCEETRPGLVRCGDSAWRPHPSWSGGTACSVTASPPGANRPHLRPPTAPSPTACPSAPGLPRPASPRPPAPSRPPPWGISGQLKNNVSCPLESSWRRAFSDNGIKIDRCLGTHTSLDA